MGEKPHGAVALAAAGVLSAFLGGGVCYFNKEDKQEPVAHKLTDGKALKENFVLTDGESLNKSFILTDGKFLKESFILTDEEALKEEAMKKRFEKELFKREDQPNARGSATFETNDFRPWYFGSSVPTMEEFEMLELRRRELRSDTS